MDLYKKILELDSVYEGEGQQPGSFETNNPNEAIKEIVRRMFPGVSGSFPITENINLNLGPGVDEISAGGQFDVGGGELSIGGGMRGDDKAFGIEFRKQFSNGSLSEEYYGKSQLAYQKAVKDGFQGTYEEYLRFISPTKSFADGGMLVQPGFGGTRQGYSGRKLTDLKNYGERGAKKITIYGKDYRLNTKGPNAGKVSFQTTKKGKDITLYLTPKQLKDRLDTPRETGFVTGQQTKLAKKIDKNLNTWSKNWVKNNIKNYGVRDFKNFTKDMANAWSKELKDNPNKYPSKFGVGTRLTNEFGLPVVRGGFQIEGITFPQRPDRPGFNPELTWQKLFINNKLKDKDFKAKVNSYLDWNLSKKVDGGAGAMTKTAALDYGKFTKGFDEDVVYLMGEILNNRALNPGGGQVGINDIFKNAFGKKGEAYFKKYQGSWGRWKNNFDAVAKLAGLDQSQANALLQKQINDSQNIMKLFNVKNLPPEFVVAQDHLFGLAEAKELGDPRIARQTLKALVATTKEQNRILGQGGFSQKRTALIKNFKKAPLEKKATIVNQLNTLADEYVPGRIKYNIKKDGSLKITNLQPEPTLKSKATAYRDLAKNFPANIKKRLASLSNNPACAVFAGKRGKFQPGGSPNANLDDCVKGGIDAINSGKVPKEKATDFVKILKGGGTALRNITKYGVLPEAIFFTADSLIRLGLGDTFTEAGLRASDYLLPGDQTKAADVAKVSRIFGDKTGEIVSRSIDYKNTINRINNLESQKQNLEALNVPSDFSYTGDLTPDIKNVDASIAQSKKDLENKFFMPLEQRLFADRKFDEAYDVSKAKSGTIQTLGKLRETSDAMDLEDFSGLQSDAQAPTPLKLDTTMFPSFSQDMQAANLSEDEIRRYFESIGQSPDEFLKTQESFKNLKKLPISTLAQIYGDEQLYGTQGASALGEPLANGGIAGLSGGDKSGPPPERGPDSEGLRSLMKRGINL